MHLHLESRKSTGVLKKSWETVAEKEYKPCLGHLAAEKRIQTVLLDHHLLTVTTLLVDFEEEMGSEEESGKDWSELEEEAARGT